MTKDELVKRLFKIEATPQRNVVPPRDSIRRELSNIEVNKDDDSGFDNFFDFEKDIIELEPARTQLEKISVSDSFRSDNATTESTFITIEEDADAKSGDADSFFVLEEISEDIQTTTNECYKEEDCEIVLHEDEDEFKENKDEKIKEIQVIENEVKSDVESDNNIVTEFKFCKYVKDSGDSCKRQAPKYNDYCSAHRKLLAKQNK